MWFLSVITLSLTGEEEGQMATLWTGDDVWRRDRHHETWERRRRRGKIIPWSHIHVRGWAEKFIGWLWCNGRIWPKCGFVSNIVSPAVHTLLLSVLQRLDSRGIEALILILEKNPQLKIMTSSIISPILLPSQVLLHVGELKLVRWCQIRSSWGGDQPVQSHSNAQQPSQAQTCVQEHCPGETGLPSSVFQAVLKCL